VKTFQNRSNKIEFDDVMPDKRRGITREDIDLNRQFIEYAQQPKYQAMYEAGKKDIDVLTDIYNQATGNVAKAPLSDVSKAKNKKNKL
jgi:hypothetical protein